MKSKRQAAREKRKRKRQFSVLIWVVVGVSVVVLFVYIGMSSAQPDSGTGDTTQIGQPVPVEEDLSHVPEGQDPGPFNTDPPTSGRHYAGEFEAGFYEQTDPEAAYLYPEGYLVHNLEHGYVIFWYNCDLLDDLSCEALKADIRGVMEKEKNFKVIAFPWKSLDVPVVMTSWGRLERFETFDPVLAEAFVVQNRNKAPEPQAP